MFYAIYEYLQDCIPAWVVSLLIVMGLFWFTMSPFLMGLAGAIWSLLFWTAALVWSFANAMKHHGVHIERPAKG